MIGRALLFLIAGLVPVISASAAEITVGPGEGTLARAVEQAGVGDILRLRPGTYAGPVMIDKPLTISGVAGSQVVGVKMGSVITIDAADVTVEGLAISGSGKNHTGIDSGVKLTKKALRAHVLNNVLRENLYGIDIHGARDSLVAHNRIEGLQLHRMNARGNGVYIWSAQGAVVESNEIRFGRDGIFVNSSKKNILRGNHFEDLRFAIHYMYADDGEVTDNVSVGNHLGYALMFSSGLKVTNNISIGDRQHGIMLNYANNAEIVGNAVRDGQEKCLFMYNANKNVIRDNWFEHCPIGIHFTAGSERNEISGNAFIGNRIQVKYIGTKLHDWSAGGRGNFWSDHAAFDMNGDGIADQSFRPNDRIDQVLWTQPSAKLLLGSPAIQLIRWAQREFPTLLPGGVVDPAPLMHPVMSTAAAAARSMAK